MGGGPAGLAAGLALARAGWSIDVYEQGETVGGLARTVESNGFRFDIGGHRWFSKKDELNNFIADLLGEELVVVKRTSRILFRGKSVDYPLRLTNALASIGPISAARAAGDLLQMYRTPSTSPSAGRSMEDAYVAQYGRTLYELFFQKYSEKVWGRQCDEMSGDWVVQRTKGLTLDSAIRDTVRRSRGKVESLADRFLYPALGYGRISERMADVIQQAGGEIHLGWRVAEMEHQPGTGRILNLTVTDGNDEQTAEADVFISSIPMNELVRIARPQADADVLAAGNELTFRHLITAHLLVNRPSITTDTWIYVHEPEISFARLHEPRNWSPQLAPEGKSSLVLELFCEMDDATWLSNDEDILARVERDLVYGLHILEPGEVFGGFIVRSANAYPRYSLGYRDAVTRVKGYLGNFSNLLIVGRGGAFQYNNTDQAIESGLLAAGRVLGAPMDSGRTNDVDEYLETGLPASSLVSR